MKPFPLTYTIGEIFEKCSILLKVKEGNLTGIGLTSVRSQSAPNPVFHHLDIRLVQTEEQRKDRNDGRYQHRIDDSPDQEF